MLSQGKQDLIKTFFSLFLLVCGVLKCWARPYILLLSCDWIVFWNFEDLGSQSSNFRGAVEGATWM